MVQVARNVTMEEWGFLAPGQYLIHDRDTKFCAAFQHIIDDAGVERVVLPPGQAHLAIERVFRYSARVTLPSEAPCIARRTPHGYACALIVS